jgi:hypothetical protein
MRLHFFLKDVSLVLFDFERGGEPTTQVSGELDCTILPQCVLFLLSRVKCPASCVGIAPTDLDVTDQASRA